MIRFTAISAILVFVTLLLESESVLISSSNGDHALVLLPYNSADPVPGLASINRPKRNTQSSSTPLHIAFYRIHSDIRYRYSRTFVASTVKNEDSRNAQEFTFQVELPEKAFISKFIMEIDDMLYTAVVKEKEDAERVYGHFQGRGLSAGLVALNTMESKVFNVSVNMKAGSTVTFHLSYEELLSRSFLGYTQRFNFRGRQLQASPHKIIIFASIEETQNLKHVISSTFPTSVEAVIQRPSPKMANITWTFTKEYKFQSVQSMFLDTFSVHYDVERKSGAGEILVMNGYFVHFFTPPALKLLPKHVVFVLDISDAESGQKIEQTKEAMLKILSDLRSEDYFNIIIFSTDVVHWSPGDTFRDPSGSGSSSYSQKVPGIPAFQGKVNLRRPFPASSDNINKTKEFIQSLQASGGTNIHDALMEALNLTVVIRSGDEPNTDQGSNRSVITEQSVKRTAAKTQVIQEILPPSVESLIIFLTGGWPTVGVTDKGLILTLVQAANRQSSIPIFSLAFGEWADFAFVRTLSLQNSAFARKIYVGADAALQLQDFYTEIASQVLAEVLFNYTSSDAPYTVNEVTAQRFPMFFRNGEIVVAGRMHKNDDSNKCGSMNTGHIRISYFEGNEHQYFRDHMKEISNMREKDPARYEKFVERFGREWIELLSDPTFYVNDLAAFCEGTTRTTPSPEKLKRQEDGFLERLWAYLTIQQLIEKDLTENGNSSTMAGEEAPKKMALRLALKYGFVTPLTSLVVATPDGKTYISNSRIADMLAQRKTNLRFSLGSAILNRYPRVKVSAAQLGGGDIRSLPMEETTSQPMMSSDISATEISSETTAAVQDDQMETVTRKMSEQRKTKEENVEQAPSTTTRSAGRTTRRPLTLRAVKWWRGGEINFSKRNYKVLRAQESIDMSASGGAKQCNIRYGNNAPTSKVKGQCKHLKDCVRNAFADDFALYKKAYFCPIRVAEVFYAGVCCDEKRKTG